MIHTIIYISVILTSALTLNIELTPVSTLTKYDAETAATAVSLKAPTSFVVTIKDTHLMPPAFDGDDTRDSTPVRTPLKL